MQKPDWIELRSSTLHRWAAALHCRACLHAINIRCIFIFRPQAMAGRKQTKAEIPETPFGALGSSSGEGQGQRLGTSRLNSRDSDRASRQPPIYEDQEQRQQPREKGPQYFSSIDSDRIRGSQLGSKDSLARTPEFPSKATTRASSAGSRCPFLPCHGCMEQCLDTKDAQQHYRPSWVCPKSCLYFYIPSLSPQSSFCKGLYGL